MTSRCKECVPMFFFLPHRPQKSPQYYAPITVGCYNKWNNQNTSGSQALLRRDWSHHACRKGEAGQVVFLALMCFFSYTTLWLECNRLHATKLFFSLLCDSKGKWTIINSVCDTRTQRTGESSYFLPAFFLNAKTQTDIYYSFHSHQLK